MRTVYTNQNTGIYIIFVLCLKITLIINSCIENLNSLKVISFDNKKKLKKMSNANKQEYFGNICLRTIILPLVEEISELLIIAFGPTGDAVMIHQNSPQEIKITKVQIKILQNETEYTFLKNVIIIII